MASQTIKQYLDRLTMLFYAMIALPMLLFAWVYLPIKDHLTWIDDAQAIWLRAVLFAVGLVLLGASFWAIRRSKKNLKTIEKQQPLLAKLKSYSLQWNASYLWVMATSLIAVMLLFLTHNQLFVAVYALLLFLVSLYRPTLNRLSGDLPLTEEELGTVKDQGEIT